MLVNKEKHEPEGNRVLASSQNVLYSWNFMGKPFRRQQTPRCAVEVTVSGGSGLLRRGASCRAPPVRVYRPRWAVGRLALESAWRFRVNYPTGLGRRRALFLYCLDRFLDDRGRLLGRRFVLETHDGREPRVDDLCHEKYDVDARYGDVHVGQARGPHEVHPGQSPFAATSRPAAPLVPALAFLRPASRQGRRRFPPRIIWAPYLADASRPATIDAHGTEVTLMGKAEEANTAMPAGTTSPSWISKFKPSMSTATAPQPPQTRRRVRRRWRPRLRY